MRKMMRKSDSKHSQETPEEELKRLRKEVARLEGKLEAQKQAANAKIVTPKPRWTRCARNSKKKKSRSQCSAKNNGRAF